MTDQDTDKDALKGEDVELRKARQKAYKARQREAADLLGKLWRMRKLRETGGAPLYAWQAPSWPDLLVMIRQLIHEESLAAGVPDLPGSRAPGSGRRGRARRQPGATDGPGLSTDHISATEGDGGAGNSSTLPVSKQTSGTGGSPTSKRAHRKKKNGK